MNLTPTVRRYCRYDFVGRLSWIESLGPAPSGDCDGPLLQVVATDDVQLCERHWLQLHHAGHKLVVQTLRTGAR